MYSNQLMRMKQKVLFCQGITGILTMVSFPACSGSVGAGGAVHHRKALSRRPTLLMAAEKQKRGRGNGRVLMLPSWICLE